MNLRRSYFDVTFSLKSCPQCSEEADRLVFKLFPDAYGAHNTRPVMGHSAQSWCFDCRSYGKRSDWPEVAYSGPIYDASKAACGEVLAVKTFSSRGVYQVGDQLVTRLWGKVEVIGVEGRSLTVRYGEGATRVLNLEPLQEAI